MILNTPYQQLKAKFAVTPFLVSSKMDNQAYFVSSESEAMAIPGVVPQDISIALEVFAQAAGTRDRKFTMRQASKFTGEPRGAQWGAGRLFINPIKGDDQRLYVSWRDTFILATCAAMFRGGATPAMCTNIAKVLR